MSELKPCPACGGTAAKITGGNSRWVECLDENCSLYGPDNDPMGLKWNALPRRDDPPADGQQKMRCFNCDSDFLGFPICTKCEGRSRMRFEAACAAMSGILPALHSGIRTVDVEKMANDCALIADALLAALEAKR